MSRREFRRRCRCACRKPSAHRPTYGSKCRRSLISGRLRGRSEKKLRRLRKSPESTGKESKLRFQPAARAFTACGSTHNDNATDAREGGENPPLPRNCKRKRPRPVSRG